MSGQKRHQTLLSERLVFGPFSRWRSLAAVESLQYVWAMWGNVLTGFVIARRNHEHRTLAVLCFAETVPLVTFRFRSTGWPAEIVITGLAQFCIFLGGGLLFKRTRSEGVS